MGIIALIPGFSMKHREVVQVKLPGSVAKGCTPSPSPPVDQRPSAAAANAEDFLHGWGSFFLDIGPPRRG